MGIYCSWFYSLYDGMGDIGTMPEDWFCWGNKGDTWTSGITVIGGRNEIFSRIYDGWGGVYENDNG